MNGNHTDDLLGVIRLLGDMPEKVVRRRDGPCHMRGRARQQETFRQLSIIEIELGFASQALQELWETMKTEREEQKDRSPVQRGAANKGDN